MPIHSASTVTAARWWYELGLTYSPYRNGRLWRFNELQNRREHCWTEQCRACRITKSIGSAEAYDFGFCRYVCFLQLCTYDRFTISCHEMRRLGAHDIVLTDPG